MRGAKRLAKELNNMKKNPPWGISCNTINDDVFEHLEATVMGPRDSPYENGTFKIQIDIPESYPFEPPQVKFITPVYHPNIDKGGRICMDLVKMPPAGGWKPTITLESLLLSIQALLQSPNPDDPLMLDIATQYKANREEFIKEATAATQKYAI